MKYWLRRMAGLAVLGAATLWSGGSWAADFCEAFPRGEKYSLPSDNGRTLSFEVSYSSNDIDRVKPFGLHITPKKACPLPVTGLFRMQAVVDLNLTGDRTAAMIVNDDNKNATSIYFDEAKNKPYSVPIFYFRKWDSHADADFCFAASSLGAELKPMAVPLAYIWKRTGRECQGQAPEEMKKTFWVVNDKGGPAVIVMEDPLRVGADGRFEPADLRSVLDRLNNALRQRDRDLKSPPEQAQVAAGKTPQQTEAGKDKNASSGSVREASRTARIILYNQKSGAGEPDIWVRLAPTKTTAETLKTFEVKTDSAGGATLPLPPGNDLYLYYRSQAKPQREPTAVVNLSGLRLGFGRDFTRLPIGYGAPDELKGQSYAWSFELGKTEEKQKLKVVYGEQELFESPAKRAAVLNRTEADYRSFDPARLKLVDLGSGVTYAASATFQIVSDAATGVETTRYTISRSAPEAIEAGRLKFYPLEWGEKGYKLSPPTQDCKYSLTINQNTVNLVHGFDEEGHAPDYVLIEKKSADELGRIAVGAQLSVKIDGQPQRCQVGVVSPQKVGARALSATPADVLRDPERSGAIWFLPRPARAELLVVVAPDPEVRGTQPVGRWNMFAEKLKIALNKLLQMKNGSEYYFSRAMVFKQKPEAKGVADLAELATATPGPGHGLFSGGNEADKLARAYEEGGPLIIDKWTPERLVAAGGNGVKYGRPLVLFIGGSPLANLPVCDQMKTIETNFGGARGEDGPDWRLVFVEFAPREKDLAESDKLEKFKTIDDMGIYKCSDAKERRLSYFSFAIEDAIVRPDRGEAVLNAVIDFVEKFVTGRAPASGH